MTSFYILQAYVQQLESSRIRLQQIEQDLQRVRTQVIICFFSSLINFNDIVKEPAIYSYFY
jgi:hypothetical protein